MKYPLVVFFGLIGLFIGDFYGPATGLIFHWDFGYPEWLSSYVYYHHYFQLGVLTSTFSMIPALIFRLKFVIPLTSSFVICSLRNLLDSYRVEGILRFEHFEHFAPYVIPIIVGMLTTIGFLTLLNEYKVGRLFNRKT